MRQRRSAPALSRLPDDIRELVRQQTGPVRRFANAPLALTREAGEGSTTSAVVGFRGHAIVYDQWTEIYDWFGSYQERIARGAFASSMVEDDVRCLFNHDPSLILGRRRGLDLDTLRLSDDATGLLAECDMDSRVSYVRDLAVALERGDVSGMSFAMEVTRDEWDIRPDGGSYMRTILEGKLYDVSPVTYPAYEQTDSGLRSLIGFRALRAAFAKREGKRNSAADAAVLSASIESAKAWSADLDDIAADLTEALDGISDADTATSVQDAASRCTALSDELVDLATDLSELLGDEEGETDDAGDTQTNSERARQRSLAQNQARRHEALRALHAGAA